MQRGLTSRVRREIAPLRVQVQLDPTRSRDELQPSLVARCASEILQLGDGLEDRAGVDGGQILSETLVWAFAEGDVVVNVAVETDLVAVPGVSIIVRLIVEI